MSQEDLVLTPGGLRPKSLVHKVDAGHTVDRSDGRVRLLNASGALVRDVGAVQRAAEDQPLMPLNVAHPPPAAPEHGSGWITYTTWTNETGPPLSSFATTWTVPPPPRTQSGQTIFLFNGAMNSGWIYQPVLQWGSSGAGGGNYWSVASWYVDRHGHALHSSLVRVSPGDGLTGIMTLTAKSNEGCNYYCQFLGIENSSLAIEKVDALTWLVETIEGYEITQCSDYPAGKTAMRTINVRCGTSIPALEWIVMDMVTECGQHSVVVDNSPSGGEIDLVLPG